MERPPGAARSDRWPRLAPEGTLKLRLTQPDQEPIEFDSEGDQVTIGRAEGCDLRLSTPYVSNRHLLLIQGLVAIDLGSSNGTFLEGNRIEEPISVAGRVLCLGNKSVQLEVFGDVAQAQPADSDAGAGVAAHELQAELEAERERTRQMGTERDQLTVQLHGLQSRLMSLKGEVEGGIQEQAESVSLKLAQDELKAMRTQNESLQRRLDAAIAAPGGTPDPSSGSTQAAGTTAAAKPSPMGIDMFMQLQRDNATLRARLTELEAGGATAGQQPAAELFYGLQQENEELKSQLKKAKGESDSERSSIGEGGKLTSLSNALGRPGDLTTSPGSGSMPVLGELSGGSALPTPSPIGDLRTPPRPSEKTQMTPTPTQPVPRTEPGRNTDDTTRALMEALGGPAKEIIAPRGCSPIDFLMFENLRFVMSVERFITYLAGDAIELLNPVTMLPGTEENFRGRAYAVLDEPQDPHLRDDMSDYLGELSKWLVVLQKAITQSATRFAEELKLDLSERKLAQRGSPVKSMLPFRADAELWKRTVEYLNELTPEIIDDRLERIIRESVERLTDSSQNEL
ncbi:MAG: hypothetical protein ACI841_003010 [Planctomycetota bacterium]|jgi:hypothetical protein